MIPSIGSPEIVLTFAYLFCALIVAPYLAGCKSPTGRVSLKDFSRSTTIAGGTILSVYCRFFERVEVLVATQLAAHRVPLGRSVEIAGLFLVGVVLYAAWVASIERDYSDEFAASGGAADTKVWRNYFRFVIVSNGLTLLTQALIIWLVRRF